MNWYLLHLYTILSNSSGKHGKDIAYDCVGHGVILRLHCDSMPRMTRNLRFTSEQCPKFPKIQQHAMLKRP